MSNTIKYEFSKDNATTSAENIEYKSFLINAEVILIDLFSKYII